MNGCPQRNPIASIMQILENKSVDNNTRKKEKINIPGPAVDPER